MKLEGKVALVTGAGRGLGRACALRLASLGADIVINDISLDSAKEFQEELTAETVMDEVKALGRRSIGIVADVTQKEEVEAMFKKALDEFGHIDVLLNNAGGTQTKTGGVLSGDSLGISEEDIGTVIDRNLMSTIFCCQSAIPVMKAQRSGVITNMASRAGVAITFGSELGNYGRMTYYGTAKAAIIHYTRMLAAEFGPYGIRVNCIAPGVILTSKISTWGQEGISRHEVALQGIPLGHLGQPEDIAKVVEFLCTDLSDYVTGQCIRVDGGRSLF